MNKRILRENLTYLVLWLVLGLAPVFSMYVRTQSSDFEFYWEEIFSIWKVYAVYIVIFLIHNFILAPILVNKHKKALYFGLTSCLIVAFIGFQYVSHQERRRGHENRFEMRDHPGRHLDHEMHPAKANEIKQDFRPETKSDNKPEMRPDMKRDRPPFLIPGGPELISSIMAILLLGMNLGIKLYFRGEKREKDMLLLEQQNLNSQLEYLKYQINPHFFMNTLNNIHALVDIDPEQSKQTIVQLSKMMRYVLYEGNKQFVPIKSEHIFLENYIQLMSLRFDPKKVEIKTSAPGMAESNKMIPPLLIINFIENAFKHGISYQQQSFIHIDAHLEDNRFVFNCKNSKHPESTEEHGGVGLTNTRKRLDLLFGENYTLEVNDEAETYSVHLNIPLS